MNNHLIHSWLWNYLDLTRKGFMSKIFCWDSEQFRIKIRYIGAI